MGIIIINMNLLKHILTEEENEYLEPCLEFINSQDDETVKLGISLFHEKFGNYRFPINFNGQLRLVKIYPDQEFISKSIIRFLFKHRYCYY